MMPTTMTTAATTKRRDKHGLEIGSDGCRVTTAPAPLSMSRWSDDGSALASLSLSRACRGRRALWS